MVSMQAASKIAVAASLFSAVGCRDLDISAPSPTSLILSDTIYERYLRSARNLTNSLFPFVTDAAGQWSSLPADSWTSGFYSGVLYLLHERQSLCPSASYAAQTTDWLDLAQLWSEGLRPLAKGNSQGHDQGFLAIPFVEELRIDPENEAANHTLTNFAYLLADRYSDTVRATRSWESGHDDFLVVIDNMMNLELLFRAADANPNTFPLIAENHAKTTLQHHLRNDGSSFHVVDYSPRNGEIQRRYTAQGYADWSTWTRGQAWGIYGFAKMYQCTQYRPFLDTSLKMARVFIDRLASSPNTIDGVPAWDFDAPPPASADTTAASVAAAGFVHLADGLEKADEISEAQLWVDRSFKLLSDTARKYFSPYNSGWQSILTNGTSFYSKGEKDQGVIYGDYYFVEAGNLLLKKGLINCPTHIEPTPVEPAQPSSSIHLANLDVHTLSSHPVLVLSCILFATTLLNL